MKIGNKVKTKHGEGIMVGFDLSNSRAKRFIVKIEKEYGKPILKSSFPNNELCYFSHELELIK